MTGGAGGFPSFLSSVSSVSAGLSSSINDHQAFNSQTTASFANSSIVTSSATATGSIFRAKPGHCNGTLSSPIASPTSAQLPNLLTTLSPVPRATDLLLTGIADNSCSSLTDRTEDRSIVSPKIAKSFRSRITLGLRSPPKLLQEREINDNNPEKPPPGGVDEVDHQNGHENSSRTYVPGDPINDIPSLSPPPYKGPGSTGGSSTTSNSGGRSGITGLGNFYFFLSSVLFLAISTLL